MTYIIVTILSIVLGQIVYHLNRKMPSVVAEEISYSDFFKSLFSDYRWDIKYTAILLLLSNALAYQLGNTYYLYLCVFLIATLLIVFSIDYRFQLIPDEAHVVIALLGGINLLFHLPDWGNYIVGAFTGGIIFYLISILALVIFKKEGMGFGDVKLMAALGFFFGFKTILVITLVSFFLGAVIGIILILFSKKNATMYMPFGPFIVMGVILLLFISPNTIIGWYLSVCLFLSEGIVNLIG